MRSISCRRGQSRRAAGTELGWTGSVPLVPYGLVGPMDASDGHPSSASLAAVLIDTCCLGTVYYYSVRETGRAAFCG